MGLTEFRKMLPRSTLWVFGYASLMWSPGFRFSACSPAYLYGYHRSLCIYSHRHRGTRQRPGLVMGLCRGGSCWGMAFRVAAARGNEVLTELWRREMRGRVYMPRIVPLRLPPGRRVQALTFVADSRHRQFAGDLDVERTARLVADGHGQRGRNVDYLSRTLVHMHELGVIDPHLDRVLDLAQEYLSRDSRNGA